MRGHGHEREMSDTLSLTVLIQMALEGRAVPLYLQLQSPCSNGEHIVHLSCVISCQDCFVFLPSRQRNKETSGKIIEITKRTNTLDKNGQTGISGNAAQLSNTVRASKSGSKQYC